MLRPFRLPTRNIGTEHLEKLYVEQEAREEESQKVDDLKSRLANLRACLSGILAPQVIDAIECGRPIIEHDNETITVQLKQFERKESKFYMFVKKEWPRKKAAPHAGPSIGN